MVQRSREISLCIPRTGSEVTKEIVMRVMGELDLGEIKEIDVVNKKNEKDEVCKRIFIHYKNWNSTEKAEMVKERLMSGKEIKVVYDFPWFWKISVSKAKRL